MPRRSRGRTPFLRAHKARGTEHRYCSSTVRTCTHGGRRGLGGRGMGDGGSCQRARTQSVSSPLLPGCLTPVQATGPLDSSPSPPQVLPGVAAQGPPCSIAPDYDREPCYSSSQVLLFRRSPRPVLLLRPWLVACSWSWNITIHGRLLLLSLPLEPFNSPPIAAPPPAAFSHFSHLARLDHFPCDSPRPDHSFSSNALLAWCAFLDHTLLPPGPLDPTWVHW